MDFTFNEEYSNEQENFQLGTLDNFPGYVVVIEDPDNKYFGEREGEEPVRSVVLGITDVEYAHKDDDEAALLNLINILRMTVPNDRLIAKNGNVQVKNPQPSIDNGNYEMYRLICQYGYATADQATKWIANPILKADTVDQELIDSNDINMNSRLIIMMRELLRNKEEVALPNEKLQALARGIGKNIRECDELYTIQHEQGAFFVGGTTSIFVFSNVQLANLFAQRINANNNGFKVVRFKPEHVVPFFNSIKANGINLVVLNTGGCEIRTDIETVIPTVLPEDTSTLENLTVTQFIPFYNTALREADNPVSDSIKKYFYDKLFASEKLYMMSNKGVDQNFPTIDAGGFAWFFTEERYAKDAMNKNRNVPFAYQEVSGERFKKMLEGDFFRYGINNIRFNAGNMQADVNRDDALDSPEGVRGYSITNSKLCFEYIRFVQGNSAKIRQMAEPHLKAVFEEMRKTLFVAPMYYGGERGKKVYDRKLHFSTHAKTACETTPVNFYNEGEITDVFEGSTGKTMHYETITRHQDGKPDDVCFPIFTDYKECNKMFDKDMYRMCVVTFDDVMEELKKKNLKTAVINCKSFGLNIAREEKKEGIINDKD